jgi:hypothetical protein
LASTTRKAATPDPAGLGRIAARPLQDDCCGKNGAKLALLGTLRAGLFRMLMEDHQMRAIGDGHR